MGTLLLRLVGPMQSWGTRSRFDDRDSEQEPSKSGVLGLVAAALGLDRAEPVDHLARLAFGVRVDREGLVRTDYHTAQLYPGERRTSTSLTRRVYLSDAAFYAGLSGDASLLTEIQAALKNPHWPLALGRKAFLPSLPVWLPEGVQDGPLLEVLRLAPSLRGCERLPDEERRQRCQDAPYRFVVDQRAVPDDLPGRERLSPAERRDEPAGPFAARRYALRAVYVFSERLTLPPRQPDEEVPSCTSPA
ncbi:type I-E CRISPR-associated protein Cas5/CasD [Deinococcus sp. YIM 77859]|uniref:type I-E CRISPR-associated protein Cas5/CasD n=1 Tax=Deinococcus sp. YIM 77859 TaxID=1540221 RepID=UPI0005552D96|nr:type I-E CRISPR-associated protein Cas5/CasD [Deinococcus sp. YIM 77859]